MAKYETGQSIWWFYDVLSLPRQAIIAGLPTYNNQYYDLCFKDDNPHIGWVIESYPEYNIYTTEKEALFAYITFVIDGIKEDLANMQQAFDRYIALKEKADEDFKKFNVYTDDEGIIHVPGTEIWE